MGVSGSPDDEIFLLKHPPTSPAPAVSVRGGAVVAGIKCELLWLELNVSTADGGYSAQCV